eukprot:COSAG05_NODE_381_length_10519_cov_17.942131_6_plen_97_part_00
MQLYGGTAWTTLHRSFVNYTWGCLAKTERLGGAALRGDDTDADELYCHSLQGLLRCCNLSVSHRLVAQATDLQVPDHAGTWRPTFALKSCLSRQHS